MCYRKPSNIASEIQNKENTWQFRQEANNAGFSHIQRAEIKNGK
jgi:hypothetical protein